MKYLLILSLLLSGCANAKNSEFNSKVYKAIQLKKDCEDRYKAYGIDTIFDEEDSTCYILSNSIYPVRIFKLPDDTDKQYQIDRVISMAYMAGREWDLRERDWRTIND
jgi:hypothetical protein